VFAVGDNVQQLYAQLDSQLIVLTKVGLPFNDLDLKNYSPFVVSLSNHEFDSSSFDKLRANGIINDYTLP
jgi:hypothetical protein